MVVAGGVVFPEDGGGGGGHDDGWMDGWMDGWGGNPKSRPHHPDYLIPLEIPGPWSRYMSPVSLGTA